MKRITGILFYALFGLLAGVQISPEMAIICSVLFSAVGFYVSGLTFPIGIFGAGSLTDLAEAAFLDLLFLNTDWANVGDAAGLQNSTAAGSFYIALFTVAPSDSAAGTECAYGSYARVAVARTAGGWSRTGSTMSNVANIDFPEATSGTETAVAAAIMTASTAGDRIGWCDLSPNISISTGTIPRIPAGDLDITMD